MCKFRALVLSLEEKVKYGCSGQQQKTRKLDEFNFQHMRDNYCGKQFQCFLTYYVFIGYSKDINGKV